MHDTARRNAVLKRSYHVILAYQVRKRLAAIFTIERKERHRENSRISREVCVAQPFDLPLLPSGPGGVSRRSAAQFPADCLNFSTPPRDPGAYEQAYFRIELLSANRRRQSDDPVGIGADVAAFEVRR